MGAERMSDTQCLRVTGGCPSSVQSTKSDAPGMEGYWLSGYHYVQDIGSSGDVVLIGGLGVRSKV